MSNELSSTQIQNEKLEFKLLQMQDNVVPLVKHEKILSELNIANCQIKYKNGRISDQKDEIESLSLTIKTLHAAVKKATEEASEN